MIKIAEEGKYKLLETKEETKILILGEKQFAWIKAEGIGEILVTAHNQNLETDTLLAAGNYKLYEVKDEPNYRDNPHLQLEVGEGKVQGYLLLTGLPDDEDKRNRIIPTTEVIKSGDERN
jgi:hypothetical protein